MQGGVVVIEVRMSSSLALLVRSALYVKIEMIFSYRLGMVTPE